MGKLQTFEILFDQNKTMYSSGEPVTGSVKVDLSSSLLCKGKNQLTWWITAPKKEVGSTKTASLKFAWTSADLNGFKNRS